MTEPKQERGREFWTKWIVIALVLLGSVGLIMAGTFDTTTEAGVYPNIGAVQVWISACGLAVAAAGVVFAGRSYVWGQRAKNGHNPPPQIEP